MYFVHPQINPSFSPVLKYVGSLFSAQKSKSLFDKLSFYFPGKQIIFTDMGRSAFKVIAEKLNLRGAEILFPAYICDIFKPIFEQYDIRPIFLDIDLKTFQVKLEDIVRKITPTTKAIFICHTYGLPFDIERLRQAVGKNILIIEDCAHSFGAKTGNDGDVAFYSLYKQFPALRGGVAVCPDDWRVQLPKTSFGLRDFISFLNYFPFFALFFKKFGREIAPKIVRKEKLPFPAGINNTSLKLFANSLADFEGSLKERIKTAMFFQEELKEMGFDVQESNGNVFCYLSALVPKEFEGKRDKIVEELRKYGVFCTRIWREPIILDKNEFPNTFEAAERIINFPLQNYYTEKDIKNIIKAIKNVLEKI